LGWWGCGWADLGRSAREREEGRKWAEPREREETFFSPFSLF
jgi:hypothetical protein